MVMYEEGPYNSIKDYYKQVDTLEKINSDNISYYREVFQKHAINLHDTDKKRIELELDCLNFLTSNGQIEPRYTRKTENGDVESYPSLSSITDDDINYLKTRIENIRNIYFKTRFAHIIWIKSKQYEYAKQTVDCYFLLTENCRNLDKAVPSDYFGMEICNALWNLRHIVFSVNYRTEEFKKLVLNIINDPNKKSSCYLKLQLDCIKILLEEVKQKKLDKNVLKGLEDVCRETLLDDLNELFAINYLEIGEKISQLLGTDSNYWLLKQAEYYELLSNNKPAIIAPEYCQKAIDLYKKLKNKTKINELYKKFSFLSKSVKSCQYDIKEVDLTTCIEEYQKIAEELSSEELIKLMIYSSGIIPEYSGSKKFIETQNVFTFRFHINIIDEYGHVIRKLETEEEKLKYRIYTHYDIWYNTQSNILFHFLKKAVELKKLNANIVIKYLNNTWYGANIKKTLSNGKLYTYNWLQCIYPSIESFFIKFEKSIQCDEFADLYIQEIDSLSLKIEGMIRDMIQFANIDGFHAFYFDQENNFNWRNINQYLKDPNIPRIIPEDDLHFLKYLLIEHRNLRNRVAHSLTFLGEYGIRDMIILFIAILRLSKCPVLQ